MKLFLKYFLIIYCTQLFSQEVSFMTYNIRLDVASDGENAWSNRKEFLLSQLKYFEPDVFGIQEGMPHQTEFINKELEEYSFVGEGRDGQNKGEYSAIFFKEDVFLIKKKGTFWLSDTPKKVSIGWDAAFPRICTYALLQHRESNQKIWVFNTHFDHIGKLARVESAKLILNKIVEFNKDKLPVFFMGDLNALDGSFEVSTLNQKMKDSKSLAIEAPFGPIGTFNAFDFLKIEKPRIDYVFIMNSEKLVVQKYAVLNNSIEQKFFSDHFPVMIEVLFK